jgi:metal-responsive CopG/Arc/MetJ family transcriptional regulator
VKQAPSRERFVGVRLAEEDLERLDQIIRERGFANRSEAIRHVLRESGAHGLPRRAPGERAPRGMEVELPVSLYRELERSVENGYSSSVGAALEKALERGLDDLAQRRPQRLASEREVAGRLAADEREQRDASREGDREGGQ